MSVLKNKMLWFVLCILAIVYCYAEADGKGDFYIFMSAASDLDSQAPVFENKYVDGYHYYYSVLFALVLKPFLFLPFRLVKCCWLLFNLALFCHLLSILTRSAFVARLTEKQQSVFLAGVFLFSLNFLLGNIAHSQITILILWCCIYGLNEIINQKPLVGGMILALGINIKLLPIVFLPYLLYRGYFKAFALTVVFYFASLLLPALFIGYEYNSMLLTTWLSLVNPANQQHVLDVEERSFHGLSTLLSTLLVKDVPDVYALSIKRNLADVSLASLAKILLAVRLLLAGFALFFLKTKPFKNAHSPIEQAIEISYLLLLIPLIFPHQQHYAFLFSVPAFALVFYDLVFRFNTLSRLSRILRIALLSVVYLCANLALLLGAFSAYYDHFKLLTYGALLLIPMLASLSLKKQKTPT